MAAIDACLPDAGSRLTLALGLWYRKPFFRVCEFGFFVCFWIMPLFHDKANEAKKQYISWVVKEGKLYAHKALKRALRGKLRLFREYCAK